MKEEHDDIVDINEMIKQFEQEMSAKKASELLSDRAYELLELPSVQFKYGKLDFFPKNEIDQLQFGYRNDPDTGQIFDDWIGREYVVIGLDSTIVPSAADQIIINTKDYMLPVYWLMTDGGSWNDPELICDSLEKFNKIIKLLKENEFLLIKNLDQDIKNQLYDQICHIIGMEQVSEYWMGLLNSADYLEDMMHDDIMGENDNTNNINNESIPKSDNHPGKIRTSIQYQLSNCVLYDYVFNKWNVFSEVLLNDSLKIKQMLLNEWNRIKENLSKKDNIYLNDLNKNVTVDDFDITIKTIDKNIKVYFITFPDYLYTDSASKYVAFAVTERKIFYYTLEYSFDYYTKKPSWNLGEFYENNGIKCHRNFGSVDNPDFSSFQEQIINTINSYE